MTEQPNMVIIGPGAIGGMLTACLMEAGYAPVLVCKTEASARHIRKKGIRYYFGGNILHHRPRTASGLQGLSPDWIFVATKGQANASLGPEISRVIHPGSRIVSLQNGMSAEVLKAFVPENQLIACMVGFGAEMAEPGEIRLRSSGEYAIGYLDRNPDPKLEEAQALLSQAQPCRIAENMYGELFSKLIISSCINPLSAISNERLGTLLRNRDFRNIFIGLMREGMALAEKMNIRVAPVTGGKLDYYDFLAGSSWWKDRYRHLIMRLIGFKHRKVVPSTLQDIRKGKPTEIPLLNGWLVKKAREYDLSLPLNEQIVSLMSDIEAGNKTPSLELLRSLERPV